MHKTIRTFVKIAIIATPALYLSLILPSSVYAEGAIGPGSGLPAGGGGGGGTSITDGTSWMHFKYVGGSAGLGKEVRNFQPGGSNYGYSDVAISGECTKTGGFWQFGYNTNGYTTSNTDYYGNNHWGFGDSYGTSWSSTYDGWRDHYETSSGAWGHFTTLRYSAGKGAMKYRGTGGLDHRLYMDNIHMYTADGVSTDENYIQGELNKAKAVLNRNDRLDDVGYFCSIDHPTASFASKSSITVSHIANNGNTTKKTVTSSYNGTKTATYEFTGSDNTFTFTTTNNIKRTDSNSKATKVQYRKWTHSSATKGSYGNNQTMSIKAGKNQNITNTSQENKTLKSVQVAPGKSITVCTQIAMWRKTTFNKDTGKPLNNGYTDLTTPSSRACITVIHKVTTTVRSNSQIKITASGAKSAKTNTKTETVESGYNTISDTPSVINFYGTAAEATFSFNAINIIERKDSHNITSKFKYRKFNYSGANGYSGSWNDGTWLSLKTGKNKKFTDKNFYKVTLRNGKTSKKICARIAAWRSTLVNNEDGKTTYTELDPYKPSSIICIKIKYTATPTATAEVNMGFIGEKTTITGSGGSAYAAFFVSPSFTSTNSTLQSYLRARRESTPHYTYTSNWTTSTNYTAPADTKDPTKVADTNINSQYSSIIKSGSTSQTQAQSSSRFDINIPDDTSYTGAKICVVGINREIDDPEVQSRSVARTCYRNGDPIYNDKGEITGYERESYSCPYTQYKYTYKYYWKYSAVSCKPIAQKPSFQVTGNTLYSAGNIAGIVANKSTGGHYSSWSEYLTIAGGTTSSFGSGAAYRNGASSPSDDLNDELTIANDTSSKGGAGIDGSASGAFVESIKNMFTKDGQGNEGVVTNHFKSLVYNGDKTLTNGDLGWIDGSKTNIIIANGNLNIAAEVSNINAWVIVNGKLNTCGGKSPRDLSADDACNNNFLTINGLVYASDFELSRTRVGAGNRAASTLSAETVNLPAKSYIDSYNEALDRAKEPVAVYTQELAPRI